ncbi:hypothetical protein ACFV94_18830 [Streptomyces sp. NPDC059896]|uniref:hypothetical protein n=1 Tax=Streptomyces sp. NPDC059896 TaxID=3346993 RepID=UPI00364C8061
MSAPPAPGRDALPTTSHWGAYRVRPGAGPGADGGLGVTPHPRDPSPSPLLQQDPSRPPWCAHGDPDTLTADIPTSRLTQGRTGRHALVQAGKFTGEPPPVTVRSPPPPLARDPRPDDRPETTP